LNLSRRAKLSSPDQLLPYAQVEITHGETLRIYPQTALVSRLAARQRAALALHSGPRSAAMPTQGG